MWRKGLENQGGNRRRWGRSEKKHGRRGNTQGCKNGVAVQQERRDGISGGRILGRDFGRQPRVRVFEQRRRREEIGLRVGRGGGAATAL